MDILYFGCGFFCSGMCMDKNIIKKMFRDLNLFIVLWVLVKLVDEIDYDEIDNIGYLVFIKLNLGGLSVVIFFIYFKDEVEEVVRKGLEVDEFVMIEKYILGGEYILFILNGEVFFIIFIKFDLGFFDYEVKYLVEKGVKEEVVYLDEEF